MTDTVMNPPARPIEGQESLMSTDDLDKLAPPKPDNDKPPARAAAKKAPPRKRGRPAGAKTKPKAPPVDIAKKVTETVAAIGATVSMAGLTRGDMRLVWDGKHVVSRAESVGEAVAELAASDPKMKAALERMFTVGTWGKFGTAMAGVVLPIAAVHGAIPVGMALPFFTEGTINDDGVPVVGGVPVPPAPERPPRTPRAPRAPKPPRAPRGGTPAPADQPMPPPSTVNETNAADVGFGSDFAGLPPA